MGRSGRFIGMLVISLFALFAGAPAFAQNAPVVIGGTLGLTGPFAGPSVEYKAVYDYLAVRSR